MQEISREDELEIKLEGLINHKYLPKEPEPEQIKRQPFAKVKVECVICGGFVETAPSLALRPKYYRCDNCLIKKSDEYRQKQEKEKLEQLLIKAKEVELNWFQKLVKWAMGK